MRNGSFNLLETKQQKLDVKDRKIIDLLLINSRASFANIAKKTKLSKESVQYRYHQLIKKNIILQTYAEIDFEKLGYQQFQILLLLDESKKQRQKELINVLLNDDNVTRVLSFSDRWDLQITLLAKDLKKFNLISERMIDPFEDIIQLRDTEAVIEAQTTSAFPDAKAPLKIDKKIDKKASYDHHDLKILQQLSHDARLSTYKMKVKLSPDAIRLRIKKLQQNGIIKRFTCQLYYSTLGYQGFLFCFGSGSLSEKDEKKFFYYGKKHNNITVIKRLLGAWDLKCTIVTKQPREYHKMIKEIKQLFSHTIRTYETWNIYKEYGFTPFPKVLLKKGIVRFPVL